MLVEAKCQPIAQDVEADLVGGRIRDVARVGGAAFGRRHALLYIPRREPKKSIDVPHPARVTTRQVIVGGHDMHALSLPSEPRHGRHGGECLAFARLHLRDAAASESQRAAKLYVIHVLPQNSRRRYCRGRHELAVSRSPALLRPEVRSSLTRASSERIALIRWMANRSRSKDANNERKNCRTAPSSLAATSSRKERGFARSPVVSHL